MSQLSTFYPNLITAADIGVGTASNVTFASIQNTPIGSTTPNTGVFSGLTAPAYNMTSGGAVVLGVSPTTTALGAGAINIQANRNAATQVASAQDGIAIGNRATASAVNQSLAETIAIGFSSTASGNYSTCVGGRSTATNTYACAFGHEARAGGSSGVIALGDRTLVNGTSSIAIGTQSVASGNYAIALGPTCTAGSERSIMIGSFQSHSIPYGVGIHAVPTVRAQFATLPFSAAYWGGTTTDATANVELFLDATSANRLTLTTNTALIADILIIGNSTASSKSYWASRRVAIRRDTGNVALIGAVEGTESGSTASTPWSFTIDADTATQSLRIRVTGEASTSITWRASAFYRLV
jgi:hypothetical protein